MTYAPQAVVALGHAVQQSGGHLSAREAEQVAFAQHELINWSLQNIQPLWKDTSRNMALMAYWQQMSSRPCRVLCIPEEAQQASSGCGNSAVAGNAVEIAEAVREE